MRYILIIFFLLFTVPSEATNWCDHANVVGCYIMDTNVDPEPDQSSAGNDCAYVNTPTFSSSCTDGKKTVSGTGCYDFDGDELTCPQAVSLCNELYHTVVMWFKTDSTGTDVQGLFGDRIDTSEFALGRYRDNGEADYSIDGSGAVTVETTTSGSVDANWFHFGAVRDNTTMEIFLDGVAETSDTAPTPGDINESMSIGSIGDSVQDFYGLLDEAGFFKVALSGTDINDIMDSGLYEAEAGVTGVWFY